MYVTTSHAMLERARLITEKGEDRVPVNVSREELSYRQDDCPHNDGNQRRGEQARPISKSPAVVAQGRDCRDCKQNEYNDNRQKFCGSRAHLTTPSSKT
jgi:hypothetical protein